MLVDKALVVQAHSTYLRIHIHTACVQYSTYIHYTHIHTLHTIHTHTYIHIHYIIHTYTYYTITIHYTYLYYTILIYIHTLRYMHGGVQYTTPTHIYTEKGTSTEIHIRSVQYTYTHTMLCNIIATHTYTHREIHAYTHRERHTYAHIHTYIHTYIVYIHTHSILYTHYYQTVVHTYSIPHTRTSYIGPRTSVRGPNWATERGLAISQSERFSELKR